MQQFSLSDLLAEGRPKSSFCASTDARRDKGEVGQV